MGGAAWSLVLARQGAVAYGPLAAARGRQGAVTPRVADGSTIVTGLTRSLGQKSPGVNNTLQSQSVNLNLLLPGTQSSLSPPRVASESWGVP